MEKKIGFAAWINDRQPVNVKIGSYNVIVDRLRGIVVKHFELEE